MTIATSRLVVRTESPYNAETPLEAQTGLLTPTGSLYVRNHFSVPTEWPGLSVDGAVRKPTLLAELDLRRFPARTLVVTMECAGNGRAFLKPPASGVQWQLGAVGTAEWTGVPLRSVLEMAGLQDGVTEVLFEGADHGVPDALGEEISFQRSLAIDDALLPDVLIAYAMNGEPLTAAHGAPLRLVVPGWYGMASVKWLTKISVLRQRFEGYYQATDYVIRRQERVDPCRHMEVRAIITSPTTGKNVSPGPVEIRGYCWSGRGLVSRVQLSDNGGAGWIECHLDTESHPYAWQAWSCTWQVETRGPAELIVRGYDSQGNVQPLDPVWSSNGYANNGSRPVSVSVV